MVTQTRSSAGLGSFFAPPVAKPRWMKDQQRAKAQLQDRSARVLDPTCAEKSARNLPARLVQQRFFKDQQRCNKEEDWFTSTLNAIFKPPVAKPKWLKEQRRGHCESTKSREEDFSQVSEEPAHDIAVESERTAVEKSYVAQSVPTPGKAVVADSGLSPPVSGRLKTDLENCSSTVIIIANLKLQDGHNAILEVHAADRCKEVASGFIQDHHLDPRLQNSLERFLKEAEEVALQFPVKIEDDLNDIERRYSQN